ncbi:Fic family protein [Dietzia sp. NPDC055877]
MPFNDLPELPPRVEIETPAVFRLLIEAHRELSALQESCRRLPDPSILINAIPLLEAQASSEIENIVTTNDELFKANSLFEGFEVSPAAKEALRYRAALLAGVDDLHRRPVCTGTARLLCSSILGHEVSVRGHGGTYIGDPVRGRPVYTPPSGANTITRHLDAWERFIHSGHRLDPITAMALSHYQFEAIHPFPDGNGRTGRILNILHLIEAGLLDEPVLYLSGFIVRNKNDYYTRLRGVTEHAEWEQWILFMAEAVKSTAAWTRGFIDQIEALKRDIDARMRADEDLRSLPLGDLVSLLFTQPYIRISNVVEAGLAKRQTASRWLSKLVNSDFITETQLGREKIFINHHLLQLLLTAPVE